MGNFVIIDSVLSEPYGHFTQNKEEEHILTIVIKTFLNNKRILVFTKIPTKKNSMIICTVLKMNYLVFIYFTMNISLPVYSIVSFK